MCSSSRVVESGWKSYTNMRANVQLRQRTFARLSRSNGSQLSPNTLVVNASLSPTIFGCRILRQTSIAPNAASFTSLYPSIRLNA